MTHVVGGKVAGSVELSSQPIALAISDDGSLIIVATDDKCVQFFSGTDLALKNSIKFNTHITAAAFSPDNATFVIAKRGSNTISLYKTEDYSMILSSYWAHKGAVDSIAFSTDGKYVASASKDGYISFWTPSDVAFKVTKQAHFQGVSHIAFTKTGLASIGSDNCLKIWKLGPPEPAAASAGY